MNRHEAAYRALNACLDCDLSTEEKQADFCSDTCKNTHFDKCFDIWVETDPRLRTALSTHLCESCGTQNDNSLAICRECGTPWPEAADWKSRLDEFNTGAGNETKENATPFIEWLINEWRLSPSSKQSELAKTAIAEHIQDQKTDREERALSIWLDCAVAGLPVALGEQHAKKLKLKRVLSTLFVGLTVSGILLAIGWQLILAETGIIGDFMIEICAWGVAITVAGSGWRLNRLFRPPDPRTMKWEEIQETRKSSLEHIASWGKR